MMRGDAFVVAEMLRKAKQLEMGSGLGLRFCLRLRIEQD